jgi:hypothetical protein
MRSRGARGQPSRRRMVPVACAENFFARRMKVLVHADGSCAMLREKATKVFRCTQEAKGRPLAFVRGAILLTKERSDV